MSYGRARRIERFEQGGGNRVLGATGRDAHCLGAANWRTDDDSVQVVTFGCNSVGLSEDGTGTPGPSGSGALATPSFVPIDEGSSPLSDQYRRRRAAGDTTVPNSDGLGDTCDPDDDNDGIRDYLEAAGCNGSGPLCSLAAASDGDRVVDAAECLLGSNSSSAGSIRQRFEPSEDGDRDGLPDTPKCDRVGSGCNRADRPRHVLGDVTRDGIVNSLDLRLVARLVGPQCPAVAAQLCVSHEDR